MFSSVCEPFDAFDTINMKNMFFFKGVKPGSEGSVELAIDSIQFGAPSSAGSTDSDGVPALLETGSENKLPAPKEQRQKQPRAGPIKTQKVWQKLNF